MTEYRMQSDFGTRGIDIFIIGCGGTGGFVAEQICRLLMGRNADITLIDHDVVEHHNLFRQNFYADDVGKAKSQVLAERLSEQYQRPISFSTSKFNPDSLQYFQPMSTFRIVIGCVDNSEARQMLSSAFHGGGNSWYIDAGNGEKWGQILIGNSGEAYHMNFAFNNTDKTFTALPLPTVQRPDLLTFETPQLNDVDCAAALDLTDQDPAINHIMAGWVTHVVRRMLGGDCPYMALYLDLEQGSVRPVYATPEAVAKIMGKKDTTWLNRSDRLNRMVRGHPGINHDFDDEEDDYDDDGGDDYDGDDGGGDPYDDGIGGRDLAA